MTLATVCMAAEEMGTSDPLDTEAWSRYIRGEYAPDGLPPEAEPTDEEPCGARLRAATVLCRRCHLAVSPSQAREHTQLTDGGKRKEGRFAVGRIVRPLEEQALAKWAAEEGCLLDGALLENKWVKQNKMGGAEHEIYFEPAAQRWFKRNNLTYHTTYLEYLHRLALHNFFFPEAPVCLEGFAKSAEALLPVLSQPNVRVEHGAARAVTEKAMRLLGFERQQDDNYYSRALGILVEDLHDENVVTGEDGELYMIDPALYLDDRSKGLRLRLRAENQG